MNRTTRRAAVWTSILALCGCGGGPPPGKATFPVVGEVYVDGAPAADLTITCHDVKGLDKKDPTVSSAMTKQDGKFQISTYKSGDGIPEGEYALTFFWGELNLMTMRYGGPDRLNDRYNDPEKSEVRFAVKAGSPTDLKRIELKTK